ncbi:MAG: hypothetical protein U1F43_11595 [Myxococcota bacterium]
MGELTAWKARRFAGRIPRILQRHGTNAAVKTYAPSLGPKSAAYAAAYDAVAKYGPAYTREFAEGRTALAGLIRGLRTWAPVVAGAVVGFNESEYGDKPLVADDTIGDAERLLEIVDEARTPEGQPLAFAADLKAELEPLLAAAVKECGEAEAADVHYQQLLKVQRESLALFDEELQRFRRTLLGALGRTHKDYQKLRTAKAREPDEDDDPTEPVPPPAVAPPNPS